MLAALTRCCCRSRGALGARAVDPAELQAAVAELTGGRGVDVAFVAAGAAPAFSAALATAWRLAGGW